MSPVSKLKKLFLLILFTGLQVQWSAVYAQNAPIVLEARNLPPVAISVGAGFQNWTYESREIQQLGIPVGVQLQLMQHLQLDMGISQATVSGDGLTEISGITDTRLGLAYEIELEQANLVLNIGATLPTGVSEFTDEEFQTAAFLNLSQYDFYVPYFGQGASVAPGIAFVSTVNQSFAFSLGASYRLRSAFRPLEALLEEYNWGNELLVSAGGVFQLGSGMTALVELIYATYGSDTLNDIEVFSAGNRWFTQIALQKRFALSEAGIRIGYRDGAENLQLSEAALRPEALRSFPRAVQAGVDYKMKVRPALNFTLGADGSWFEADTFFDKMAIYRFGITPEIAVSPAVVIPLQFKYAFGDLEGLEIYAGIRAVF